MINVLKYFTISKKGSLAEWSKALVLGTSPKGRGFESHSCQNRYHFDKNIFSPPWLKQPSSFSVITSHMRKNFVLNNLAWPQPAQIMSHRALT